MSSKSHQQHTSIKMFSPINQKKPIYEVVIMGLFIEEHLSLGGNFIHKFDPSIFNPPHWHRVLSYLQADDMTVYNDELENRKMIGYGGKEKRKSGLVFLHIIFIRIMFNISFKS